MRNIDEKHSEVRNNIRNTSHCERMKRAKQSQTFGKMRLGAVVLWIVFIVLIPLSSSFAESLNAKKEKGMQLYKEKKYDEALKKFLDVQVESPDSSEITYNVGNTYYNLKKYDLAEKSFLDTALSVQDNELKKKAYYNLGNTQFRQGKLEEAVDSYKKALEIDPNDQDAKYNLEFTKQELKKREQQNQDQKDDSDKKDNQDQKDQKEDQDQQKSAENKENEQDQKDHSESAAKENDKKEEEQKSAQKPDGQDKKDEQASKAEQRQVNKEELKEMTEQEAVRWLESIQENRKKFMQKKIKKQGKRTYSGKNW